MKSFGVKYPNPSTPRRRCRHRSQTDPLKPSDARCQNCASWTDTSAALPRGETERFSSFLIEKNMSTINSVRSQNEPIFSQSIEWLANYDQRMPASFIAMISALKIDGNLVRAGGRQAG
jgi:hypothetical protein